MSATPFSDAPQTVAEQFRRAHEDFADQPALLCRDRWWTFSEVGAAARGAVNLLAEHGAVSGDRIILFLENSAVFRILEHGILSAGLVRVALSARLHVREVASIAGDCAAAVVCCSPQHEAALREALSEIDSTTRLIVLDDDEGGTTPDALASLHGSGSVNWPDPKPADTAMLMYSSGTTGRPKGAIVTHAAWIAQTDLALAQLPSIGVGDTVLAVAPMAHFGGSIGLNCAIKGAATLTLPSFDAGATLQSVVDNEITVLPLAPVMLKGLVEEASPELLRQASQTLKAIPYGGSPTDTATLISAATLFPRCLVQYYGLSETLAPVASLSAEEHDDAAAAILEGNDSEGRFRRILESTGRPPEGTLLRFRSDDSTDEPGAGSVGEIVVKSPMVTKGYWNRPELSAAALTPDGWFQTGDLGELDADGYLHLLNRKNDVIISGGYNVYPGEVERIINTLGSVKECVVIGVPHPHWGEGVHALVVLKAGLQESGRAALLPALTSEIIQVCRKNLAGFKKPGSVEILDAIPRTSAGKIDRKRLLAEYLDRHPAAR